MPKTKACGANGAKGGRSHRGGGAGGHGEQATRGTFTEDAKAINARLCGHARDGDAHGLLDYAASQRDRMNHVNLTTAMHKLAQLAKDGSMAVHLGDWRFAVLHDRVRVVLALQSRESQLPGAEVAPRCWSTLAWAYATLGVPGPCLRPVFDAIAELSMSNLRAFNLVEFTNLVWAFAKAQVPSAHFFEAVRAHIAANLASLSTSHSSMLVWALTTAKHDRAAILCELTENFARQLDTERVDPVAISNLMWGLATTKVHPKTCLLLRIGSETSKLLPAFKPHELSITAWAFSRLRLRHNQLFAAVAERLRRAPDFHRRMHAQGLANLMWAFNRQRALGSGVGAQLTSAMQAMLPRCVALSGQFKAQELACICQSLQESGMQRGACREAAAFWDMVAAAETGRGQKLSEAAIETASTGTGGSGPYAHSDAGSQDGDGLGMLRGDLCDGGTAGSARSPYVVDYSKAALHRACVPMHISMNSMATAADDATQVLQLPLPAAQASPMQPTRVPMHLSVSTTATAADDAAHVLQLPLPAAQASPMRPPFQREGPHSPGTSAPPSGRLGAPGQGETAGDVPPLLQSRPEGAAGAADVQAGLLFEGEVCYIVKNTFIEEAGAGGAAGPATAAYASEPLPRRAGFRAGELLTFPRLRQRPAHGTRAPPDAGPAGL